LSNLLTNSSVHYAYESSPVRILRTEFAKMDVGKTTPEAEDGLFPGYLASKDYGAEADGYALPEPAWQTRLRIATESNQLQKQYTWKINEINGSLPYPGKDFWTGKGFFQMANVTIKKYGDNYTDKVAPAIQAEPLSSMLRGI
jgi:hypothetical protein